MMLNDFVRPIIWTSTRPIFTQFAGMTVDERSQVKFFDPLMAASFVDTIDPLSTRF